MHNNEKKRLFFFFQICVDEIYGIILLKNIFFLQQLHE